MTAKPDEPDKLQKALMQAFEKACAEFEIVIPEDLQWNLMCETFSTFEKEGVEEYQIRGIISGDYITCDGYCNGD